MPFDHFSFAIHKLNLLKIELKSLIFSYLCAYYLFLLKNNIQ